MLTQLRVHPRLSKNRHPVDGALLGCWFTVAHFSSKPESSQASGALKHSAAQVFHLPKLCTLFFPHKVRSVTERACISG
jgi:hypothetical protein